MGKQARDLCHTLLLGPLTMVVRAVVNILSHAPIGHDARAFQLSKMTGDARLAHTQNLLQLGHGKLFLFQQEQQPQPGRVCQQSQQING